VAVVGCGAVVVGRAHAAEPISVQSPAPLQGAAEPQPQPSWALTWSMTVSNSPVGVKSMNSVSSRASGACPGSQ
jgi:hypothetical protein